VSCGIGAADIGVPISTRINNFELTGDPSKLVKLYNLRSLI